MAGERLLRHERQPEAESVSAPASGWDFNLRPPDRQSKRYQTKPALRRSETAFRGSGRRFSRMSGGPVHCVSGLRQDAMEDAMNEHRTRGRGIRWWKMQAILPHKLSGKGRFAIWIRES